MIRITHKQPMHHANRPAHALRGSGGDIAWMWRVLMVVAGVLGSAEVSLGDAMTARFRTDGTILEHVSIVPLLLTVILGSVAIWFAFKLKRQQWERLYFKSEQLHRLQETQAYQRIEQARRSAEARFRAMFENASAGMAHMHMDGTALALNQAMVRIIGASSSQQVMEMANELPAILFVNPQDIGEMNREMCAHGRVEGYEAQWRRLDGRLIWVRIKAHLLQTDEDEHPYTEAIITDITEEKRTENIMLSRTQALELIAQNRPLGEVMDAVMGALCEQISGARGAILIFDQGRLKPTSVKGLSDDLVREICALSRDPSAVPTLAAWGIDPIVVADSSLSAEGDHLCRLLQQNAIQTCWSAPVLGGEGGVLGVVMMCFEQISIPSATDLHLLLRRAAVLALAIEHHRLCERLVNQLMHDSLTGLANRRKLEDDFRKALDQSHHKGRRTAIFYLDIDNFKVFNDTLGHHVGDMMIQQVANRLAQAAGEEMLVARMGGDEFAIMLPEAGDTVNIEQWAQRFLDCFDVAYDVGGRELVATATLGIAIYPDHGHDPTQLQRCADTAIHHAKRAGRNRYEMYSQEMDAYAMDRLELESQLRHALESQQLHLAYQPQVDGEGRIIGLEALLRWRHPELGDVSPGRFIPVAEQTGLIIPIGKWILWEACRQAKVWSDELNRPIRVAVNVSALQFAQADLLQNLRMALQETRLPAGQLELEVTESLVMDRGAMDKLVAIRRMGVCIALDDFGTGYSCLAYLHRMPIDTIKIDRSFVNDIEPNAESHCIHNSRPVVSAIISMSQSLGMQVLAEGVETMAQRDLLVGMGCNAMQGWLYCAAQTPEKLLPLLKAGVIEPAKPQKNVA